MSTDQLLRLPLLLLTAGAMTFGLVACGSDDDDSDAAGSTGTGTATTGTPNEKKSGTTTGESGKTGKKNSGQGGQFTPGKKAPDSAGDRKNAPDDVISKRPGGPGKPVSP